MLLYLCRFLSWKIISSLFPSVHPRCSPSVRHCASEHRLGDGLRGLSIPYWLCDLRDVMQHFYAQFPDLYKGDNNCPFLSVVRIKWAIIWKYLESGNTKHYIRVCFYEMTVSCLDCWKSLLIILLVSHSNPLKSLSQYETKGIFLKWISDYDFCESSKMTLYCLYDKVHIS